jgi:hypothetical protein
MNIPLRLSLAAATLALLGACGGGSDSAPMAEPATTVPDSATASVRAYTEYTGQLIAEVHGSETAAPLLMNAASAPVSESASPLPVN